MKISNKKLVKQVLIYSAFLIAVVCPLLCLALACWIIFMGYPSTWPTPSLARFGLFDSDVGFFLFFAGGVGIVVSMAFWSGGRHVDRKAMSGDVSHK